MKKYRDLWGMSTTNHNILYFSHIPEALRPNSCICLWKAQTAPRGAAFRRRFCSKTGANAISEAVLGVLFQG
jgi:hypothetical protein